ncbi:LEAF RUST 10 DISEASE-RESISTANCE LOCUS RECEPTOR-LIKE PROTEIN KINASE-like 1.2 [Telopea speciosissima]|uniref:LEAF RUST 10 DISEASE-RESISTANCE LOCUS RECEPTOR-LIKE PROTEIN KINASE-like 1.2 n=1 Tax=Telopea speciosissima TaxID=54955 RepID=UPI001CC38B2E|nr:LEAF RUST 10 DISEASE-RESISTANCE LOCUS RECEPTOR-LIKE PROTEIN KINASE-like 1.2 [Telopea speciosissima]
MIYSLRDPFPVLIYTTLLILLINSEIQEAKSLDPQFEACSPWNCGNGPNISYPFWPPLFTKPYCGRYGYEVNCVGHKPGLMINDSQHEYHIRDIFYAKNSLRVVNANALKEDCHVPLHNLTLDGTPYSLDHHSVNLIFFYNCTRSISSLYSFPVTCSTKETGYHSFAVFEHHLNLLYNKYFFNQTCNSTVSAPVDMNGTSFVDSLQGKNYSQLLRRGFLLNWNESDNCTECRASGGHCGFQNKEFWCFCPNGRRRQNCPAVAGESIISGVSSAIFNYSFHQLSFSQFSFKVFFLLMING